MNGIKNILILLLTVCVAGCSVYGGDFECKMGNGVNCKSVSALNSMVDNNTLEQNINKKKKKKEESKAKPIKIINKPQPRLGFFARLLGKKQPLPTVTDVIKTRIYEDTVYRTPEKTMRIWVAAYTDKTGDYLENRYFYTVVAPGAWQSVVDESVIDAQ